MVGPPCQFRRRIRRPHRRPCNILQHLHHVGSSRVPFHRIKLRCKILPLLYQAIFLLYAIYFKVRQIPNFYVG